MRNALLASKWLADAADLHAAADAPERFSSRELYQDAFSPTPVPVEGGRGGRGGHSSGVNELGTAARGGHVPQDGGRGGHVLAAHWLAGVTLLFSTWPPSGVSPDRWIRYAFDGAGLVQEFGGQLAEAGWQTHELFGLHQHPDQAEPCCLGIVWLIAGRRVLDVGRAAIAVQDADEERVRIAKPLHTSPADPAWRIVSPWGTA